MDGFRIILKKTDIEQKLALKTEFVTSNGLVNGAELVVTDFSTSLRRSYIFKLAFRRIGPIKPVFRSEEWRQFVSDNCLQVGDTIDFWKGDNEMFGIRATKVMMK